MATLTLPDTEAQAGKKTANKYVYFFGGGNIFMNGAILGMTKAEITSKFDAIVEFAEVEQFIDTPVKHLFERHVPAPRFCRRRASGAGDSDR